MLTRQGLIALTTLTLVLAGCNKEAGQPIHITGSSTVFPFSKAVGDALVAADPKIPAPQIESTGTVAGIGTFCAGPGAPDILDASRRMTRDEFAKCEAQKVGAVMEIPIGLDGIAIAEGDNGPKLSLTPKDLYLALAAAPGGKPNTAKTWHDVDAKLPATPIKVLGPAPTSGTRDAFTALILEPGCLAADISAAVLRTGSDPSRFDTLCRRLRTDGPYVSAGEDYEATARALAGSGDAIGIFGYSYLEGNAGKVKAIPLDGVVPDAQTIASGKYSGARLLYLYVKKGHLKHKPAIQQYLDRYAAMWGPGGALAKIGLIPLSDNVARKSAETMKNGFALGPDDLP